MDPKEILYSSFSSQSKNQLVATINTACRMVRELCEKDFTSIPNRGRVFGSHALNFYVDRLLIDAINKGFLPFKPLEKIVSENGYCYMQYISDIVKWQIKRVRRRGQLPVNSSFRVANSISNQVVFKFGPAFDRVNEPDLPFAIVTYGHKRFIPNFVLIGLPEPDYRGWAAISDVTDAKVADLEERIYEENEPKLKKEFMTQIFQNQIREG